ncbi:MAG: histidine kinase [Betaproteobacteria bacterium]|nr:histidine kinase [Betaproteobacteria bacterium]
MSGPANAAAVPHADPDRQEALHRARKRVRDMRSFYVSASMYAVIIPSLWIVNLSARRSVWAVWPGHLRLGRRADHPRPLRVCRPFLLWRQWQAKKVEEPMARENLKVVSREKQLVRAQMRMLRRRSRPHFLFNTLANIQSLIGRAPDKASLMMDNFIAYLRETLSASRAQEGTVQQEFALLRHYLDLIKIRMADRLQYTLSLAPGLETAPMAPMLLQPLVENAIKHGLEPKVEGGAVSVDVQRAGDAGDDRMLITVETTASGSPDDPPTARAPRWDSPTCASAGGALRRARATSTSPMPVRARGSDCRAAAPEAHSLTTGTWP